MRNHLYYCKRTAEIYGKEEILAEYMVINAEVAICVAVWTDNVIRSMEGMSAEEIAGELSAFLAQEQVGKAVMEGENLRLENIRKMRPLDVYPHQFDRFYLLGSEIHGC